MGLGADDPYRVSSRQRLSYQWYYGGEKISGAIEHM